MRQECTASRIDYRWAYGLAALALTAGCSTAAEPASEAPPATTPASEQVEDSIVVYQDDGFSQPIGRIGRFSIVCADYVDPNRQDLQPQFVARYLVQEAAPVDGSPLTGFVDPHEQPLVVTGTAPSCDNLTQTSQFGGSGQAAPGN